MAGSSSETCPHRRHRPPRDRQNGIALVVVLWMLTLLTVIAGSLAYSARTTATIARNFGDAAQARRLAEAGFNKALLALTQRDPALRWPVDGTEHLWATPTGTARISIRDEAGFINVNRAGPELLDGLFRVAGVEEARRVALVDAILDWRDPDSVRREAGAEDQDYAAAGRAGGAKDGLFDTATELQQVFGMSAELFEQIEPFVTVHGRHSNISDAAAPREVLLALPGADAASVERILDARQAGQTGQGPRRAAATAEIVRIQVQAEAPSGARQGLRVVAHIRIGPNPGYSILSWQEGG